MATRLQEIHKRMKEIDKEFFAIPERERNLPSVDRIREEGRRLDDEAERIIGTPKLPHGFEYGHPSDYKGTASYAVHILPDTHTPVRAWGKIVKIDDDLEKNLAKYGMEFRGHALGTFLTPKGAPHLARYACRRQFIVAKKGLEDKFNKWYRNGHIKASVKVAHKPSTEAKEPWQMTLSEYIAPWRNKRGEINPQVAGGLRGNHRNAVSAALAQGKAVPAEVLKDYPELGKPTATDAERETAKFKELVNRLNQQERLARGRAHGFGDAARAKTRKLINKEQLRLQALGIKTDYMATGASSPLIKINKVETPPKPEPKAESKGKDVTFRPEKTDQGDLLVIYHKGEPVGNLRQIGTGKGAEVEFRSSYIDKPIRSPFTTLGDVMQRDVENIVTKYISPKLKTDEPSWVERRTYSSDKDAFGHLVTYKTKGQAEKGAEALKRKYPFYETEVYERYPGAWGVKYRKSPETLAKERAEARVKAKPEPKPRKEIVALKAKPVKQSDRALAIDRSLLARQVVAVDDPRWLARPNRFDVRGIDTPGSGRVTSRTGFTDKGKTRMSRRHHRGWKRIKL